MKAMQHDFDGDDNPVCREYSSDFAHLAAPDNFVAIDVTGRLFLTN